MSIGERLRRTRLERGLTLGDISEQTKVQHWILDAIERDDVARVPGGVFIRGYVMSFAQAIGLDGERLWADFRAELQEPTAEAAAAQPLAVPAIGPWTIVRVAAVILVVAVVWRNIGRSNPDSAAAPLPEPSPAATDIVLTAAAVDAPAPPVVAVLAPVVKTAQTAPAPPASLAPAPPQGGKRIESAATEPIASVESPSVDDPALTATSDADTNP